MTDSPIELDQEPFNLSPEELNQAWVSELPKAESELSLYFERLFFPHFELTPQVWLRSPSGHRFRIDYIAKERTGRIGGIFGFEIKRGNIAECDFSDFTNALAQCLDSSESRIQCDVKDAPDWFGQTLRQVFLFPCPYRIYEHDNRSTGASQRDMWTQGALKLAGKYGVGAITYIPKKKDWCLLVGGHPFYWLATGPTNLAIKHAVRERRGAAR